MSKTQLVFLDKNGRPLSREDAKALVQHWRIHGMPAKKAAKAKKAKAAPKAKKAKTASKSAKKTKAAPKAKKTKKASCVAKGKNKCGEDVCDTETGNCIERYANGAPKGGTKMRKDLGDDFYYDEVNGFVGRKADVLAAVAKLKGKAVKTKTKKASPPKVKKTAGAKKAKKAKKTCYDVEDPTLCDEGDVCNAASGRCVKSTGPAAKGKWRLEVDGRIIVGDEETLTKLQETLGGELTEPAAAKRGRPPKTEEPVKSKTTKVKKTKVVKTKQEPPKTGKVKKTKTKARTCYDLEDPIECGLEDICNAATGKCVRDTAQARKNMWKLIVDGRIIVGARDTLLPLQKALGGDISKADEEEEVVEETEPIEPPKKGKTATKKSKAPATELPVVPVGAPPSRPPLVKLTAKKEEIRRVFERCLQGLGE